MNAPEPWQMDPRGGPPSGRRPGRLERRAVERRRKSRRRRLGLLLALLLGAGVLAAVDFARGGLTAPDPADVQAEVPPSVPPLSAAPSSPSAEPSDSPSPTRSTPPKIPRRGTGKFDTAPGSSEVMGTGGGLLRYRVRVETDLADQLDEFTGYVDSTLGDDRSWIHSGDLRLRRVSSGSYDFTIYLATPATTDQLCAPLPTNGYTSCREGDKVVVNADRWVHAVEHWDSDLETYRRYVVNHEVGHRLGHQHERCPGKGEPAPVMQQQTLKLAGCKGNAWPYVKGKLHTGPPGGYA